MSGQERVRYMRLLVFFDLPVDTSKQRKDYRQFRKFLINDGYLMMQQSAYSKLVVDGGAAQHAITRLKKNRPPEGLVQVLKVTEKQFATITTVVGNAASHEELTTTEEFVVL